MRIEQVAIPAVRRIRKYPKLMSALLRLDKWGGTLDPANAPDPFPSLEKIREDGPVVYHSAFQQWYVTGYDEVAEILGSPEVSSAGQLEMLLTVRPYSKLDERTKRFMARWLLLVDPPDHTRLRKLVSKAFTPRQISKLEPWVEDLARTMVADFMASPNNDIVEGFTSPLPINVISELLGLPEERWEWTHQITEHLVQLLDPFGGFDAGDMNSTVAELTGYFSALCDQRRREPKDDLITGFVQAEDEGDRLDKEELISMIAFVMAAGHETTTGALGTSIIALAQNPGQRELIRSNRDLWPNAVEELLRFDTSVVTDARAAVRDIEVGGQHISAGDNILLFINAANRDPRKYENPNELHLDRVNPRPISFGHGIHYCIGAALARMELRVGLSAVLDALGDYTVDLGQVEWKTNAILRGPTKLPVHIPSASTT